MSIKKATLLLLFSIFIFTLTVWVGDKVQKRSISSNEKNSINNLRKISKPQNQFFELNIQNLSGLPNDEEKEVKLRASIKALNIPSGVVNYKWILPDGVSLVSGTLEDNLENFKSGQTAFVEISVDGVAKNAEPVAIIFHADIQSDGTRFGHSTVYTNTTSEIEVQSRFFKSNQKTDSPNYLKRRDGIQY